MLKTLTLLAASFASAFALNSVEININDKDLELAASIDMSQMNDTVEPDTVFLGVKFLHADYTNGDINSSSNMDDYIEVSFLMKRDFSSNLEIGLGMKLNATKNFASIPLGGEARYSLNTELPMYVGGSFYYAPSVLCMSDAKSFLEYRVHFDIEVIENALITVGYRSIDTNYEKPVAQDINYNSSFYAGFKFEF
ncbi:MAG: hypothetical protein ACI9TV_003033 [Sulfurimonas sp.]|jgi:hypothetical protein|uniref:YfaZ family outer membrane protein n=1 Tax=Sulfurimonas sp. TaxID=2022749 RepID=UPI0039E5230B